MSRDSKCYFGFVVEEIWAWAYYKIWMIQPANRLPARMEKKIRRAKRADECENEEFGEWSGQSRTGEPVDFVFDVPIHPWWLACNELLVNEVIRPIKKLHFLYS